MKIYLIKEFWGVSYDFDANETRDIAYMKFEDAEYELIKSGFKRANTREYPNRYERLSNLDDRQGRIDKEDEWLYMNDYWYAEITEVEVMEQRFWPCPINPESDTDSIEGYRSYYDD